MNGSTWMAATLFLFPTACTVGDDDALSSLEQERPSEKERAAQLEEWHEDLRAQASEIRACVARGDAGTRGELEAGLADALEKLRRTYQGAEDARADFDAARGAFSDASRNRLTAALEELELAIADLRERLPAAH